MADAPNSLPVIDVPVNDEGIKNLLALLAKYEEVMQRIPEQYRTPIPMPGGKGLTPKVDKQTVDYARRLEVIGQGINKTFEKTNSILKTTKGLLGDMLKFSLTSLSLIGLVSGGSLFGFDKFSRSVNNTFVTAQGQGMTSGQLEAANNVYGTRIPGTSNIIASLANAQNNGASPEAGALWGLGINPTAGAAANLPQFLSKVYDILKDLKGTGLSQSVLQSRGLGMIDVATANQIMANGGDLPKLANQYETQSVALNVPDKTQKKYQDLTTQLANDVDKVTTAFVNGLSPLTGPVGKLADEFSNAVKAFVSGPNGQAIFQWVADGLNSVGNWLNSPSFQTDLKTFADDVKSIGEGLYNALKWLNLIPDKNPAGLPTPQSGSPDNPDVGNFEHGTSGVSTNGIHYEFEKPANLIGSPLNNTPGGDTSSPVQAGFFGRLGQLALGLGRQGSTLGQVDYNPLNLSYYAMHPQPGAMMPDYKGFAVFNSMESGIAAGYKQLKIDIDKKGENTIDKLVMGWASTSPKSEQDSEKSYLAKSLGIGQNDKINSDDSDFMAKLFASLAQIESRTRFSHPEELKKVFVQASVKNSTGADINTSITAQSTPWPTFYVPGQ